MNRLKLIFLASVSLLFICGSLALFPLYFYRQIPHFGQYEDTLVLDQTVFASYDDVNCQMSVYIKQSYVTTQTSDAFWERLPSSWQADEHEFLAFHDRAIHRIRLQSFATVNNQVSILREPNKNQIFSSNTATTHFSKTICQILPFESGFIFQN